MLPSKRLRLTTAAAGLLAAAGVFGYRVAQVRVVDLSKSERSVFSPAGEDGVLEKIFEVVPASRHFLVDLGAGDGIRESSSRNLLKNRAWSGLLVESNDASAAALAVNYNGARGVKTLHALIDPGDIEIVLEKNGVPREPDLLIVGLKANDWYVWRAIQDFRPKAVQIQYNAAFAPPQTMVIEYHPLNYWDGSVYFGASIQSLYNLAKRKGYELVYANRAGTNLFLVEARYFSRFGIEDNTPWRLYRRCSTLPVILPSLLWEHLQQDGRPRPFLNDADLVVKNVRVPRTYVLGEI